MDTKTMIISIVVLVALIGFIVYRFYKNNGKDKGREETLKFLNSLASEFETVIIKYLKNIDFKNLDNLADVEKQILNDTIDRLWIITQQELVNYTANENTKELIRLFINKDFLLLFIKQFFEEDTVVQEVYTAKYNKAVVAAVYNAEQFEKKTVQENIEYKTEDLSKLPKAKSLDPNLIYDYTDGTREEPGKVIEKELNPQKDLDDVTYSTEDDSVEVLSDDTTEKQIQDEINKSE